MSFVILRIAKVFYYYLLLFQNHETIPLLLALIFPNHETVCFVILSEANNKLSAIAC